MKLIITFPTMTAEYKAKPQLNFGEPVNYEQWQVEHGKAFRKYRKAMQAAIDTLEETMFAVTMKRAHDLRFYSDHIGLHPDFMKDGFEIDAWRLTAEFIQTLEDLQKLGSFKMHFETDTGEIVSGRWWHDDEEYALYEHDDEDAQDYYDEKLHQVEAKLDAENKKATA